MVNIPCKGVKKHNEFIMRCALNVKVERLENYAKKTVSDTVDNLGVVLKAAIAADIPISNPVPLMDRNIIHGAEKPRSYLTIEEAKQLAATPTTNKRMTLLFLFSMMTGIRYSDLCSLTWNDVIEEDGKHRIEKLMVKDWQDALSADE